MSTRRPPSSVPSPPGFDLGRDYGLVRALYYGRHPGHAARVRAAGLDVDDVLQQVCLSLLHSAPWDPARGWSLKSWLGAIIRRTVGHALDSQRRRGLREELGAGEDAGEDRGAGTPAAPLEELIDLTREEEPEQAPQTPAAASRLPTFQPTRRIRKRPEAPPPPPPEPCRYTLTMSKKTPPTPQAPADTAALEELFGDFQDFSPSASGLSPNQTRAVLLIAAGRTMEEVAGEVGVTSRTITNWMGDRAFSGFLSELQDRLFVLDAARLVQLRRKALGYLDKAVTQKAVNPAGVRAALSILSRAGLPERREVQRLPDAPSRDPALVEASSDELRDRLVLIRGGGKAEGEGAA